MSLVHLLLAHAQVRSGDLDGAEASHRSAVTRDSADPKARLALAVFLAKHQPNRHDEAIREAEAALRGAERLGLPKTTIEALLRMLRSEGAGSTGNGSE